jgi:Ca-activated chloride channel homolog
VMMPDEFARPEVLSLLALLPFWGLLVWPWAGRGVIFVRGDVARRASGWRALQSLLVIALPLLLRGGAMAAIIIALAGPQRVEVTREFATKGKGLGLAVDLSTSMLATDMEGGADRMKVARDAAARFAEGRVHDEVSLVGFAGEPITRVPPTRDSGLVVEGIRSLRTQLVRDGTDISAALLTSLHLLVGSDREPRVIVLLTDGAHNGSGVPPLAAARAAAALGVRVHAISVVGPEALAAAEASREMIRQRAASVLPPDMQTVLSGIAEITGGGYFHATTAAALDSIYDQIDRLEAPVQEVTEVEVRHSQRMWPLLAGLLLLGVEALVRGSRLGILP